MVIDIEENKMLKKWIVKKINQLTCKLKGHFYRPMHSYENIPHGKVQYTCACCGKKTKWMKRKEHIKFVKKYIPTWGGRGSDSQGYKEESISSKFKL